MHADNRGFGMLEVLITLVVVAVGLLAIEALMTNNLRNASNSNWRTIAAMLSTETAERIKANSLWVTDASGNLFASPTYSGVNCSSATALPAGCTLNASGISCNTKAAWVAMDIRELCSKVASIEAGGLPDGTLQISSQTNASEGMFYRVLVSWSARGSGLSSSTATFQYQTQVRP